MVSYSGSEIWGKMGRANAPREVSQPDADDEEEEEELLELDTGREGQPRPPTALRTASSTSVLILAVVAFRERRSRVTTSELNWVMKM